MSMRTVQSNGISKGERTKPDRHTEATALHRRILAASAQPQPQTRIRDLGDLMAWVYDRVHRGFMVDR